MPKQGTIQDKETILSFDTKQGQVKKWIPLETESETRAIIYCRVSDRTQVTEGHGLEGQERVCMERCQNQIPPISIEKVFKEPWVSGSKTDRKEFNNAIAYLKEQNRKYTKITHFVVSEASRISRPDNIVEAFTLEEQIKSLGVEIVKVDAPGIDDSTDEGQLFKTIQYAIAGYERKKITKRATNGRRNRMMNGYRPFCSPPVGYIRKRISKKEYIDEIDPVKWPLIQKGLELYASNVLVTKAQLRKFRNENGLLTNANGVHKLRRTFPSQALQLHRLFYYAGFILYPDWDITEPIEGKHEGLISLTTVYNIIDKLKSSFKSSRKKQSKSLKLSDEHPLRGVITCPHCQRKFTSRNTSKMVGKGENKVKKLYPYYGCNNKNCPERVYVKKEELEQAFEKLLSSIHFPKTIHKLIDVLFEKNWQEAKRNSGLIQATKLKQIQSMKQKLAQIEKAILSTGNPKLQSKYEEDRAVLDSEIDAMEEEYISTQTTEQSMKVLLQKTKTLFDDPLVLWKLWNAPLRQLLINVRFWDNLYYSKYKWLRTTRNGSLYSILELSWEDWTMKWATYPKHKTLSMEFMDKFKSFMITNKGNIEAIWTSLEFLNLLAEDKNGQMVFNPKATKTVF